MTCFNPSAGSFALVFSEAIDLIQAIKLFDTAIFVCRSLPAAGKGRSLLSGGNDGKIRLQTWNDERESGHHSTELSEGQGCSDLAVTHGRKINFLACNMTDLSRIYVADVSKHVSMYNIR